MKIALLGNSKSKFELVFSQKLIENLKGYAELSPLIDKGSVEKHEDFLKDCEYAFSTWGMPHFTKEEIKQYFPSLKAVFYAAGSVQGFAKEFLECDIRVFSAFAANAVPVAEYTVSQIVLALKGFYQGAKRYRLLFPSSFAHTRKVEGCFGTKVGLIGVGTIGSMVAERLKQYDVEVLAYDPYMSEEKAKSLGVKSVSIEEIFSTCDVISNHLANKKELKNVFSNKLFSSMKKYSTFINTGRGSQVNEWALAKNLILHPSRTAVLDVLKMEFIPYINPLFYCPNAIITPHIAGSMGKETQRMAYYMFEQFENLVNGKETSYEVTKQMLKTMA